MSVLGVGRRVASIRRVAPVQGHASGPSGSTVVGVGVVVQVVMVVVIVVSRRCALGS